MNKTVKYYEEMTNDELMLVDGGKDSIVDTIIDAVGLIFDAIDTGRGLYSDLRQAARDAARADAYRDLGYVD